MALVWIPDGEPDDILRLHCPGCGTTVRIMRHNLQRIGRWAELRYPGDAPIRINVGKFPSDVDLTEPLNVATLDRVARAVVEATGVEVDVE